TMSCLIWSSMAVVLPVPVPPISNWCMDRSRADRHTGWPSTRPVTMPGLAVAGVVVFKQPGLFLGIKGLDVFGGLAIALGFQSLEDFLLLAIELQEFLDQGGFRLFAVIPEHNFIADGLQKGGQLAAFLSHCFQPLVNGAALGLVLALHRPF